MEQLDEGVLSVFEHWHVYALVAVGWVGMTLSQSSFQAGALAPAVATQMSLDPITSLLLGTLAFQETIHETAATVVAGARRVRRDDRRPGRARGVPAAPDQPGDGRSSNGLSRSRTAEARLSGAPGELVALGGVPGDAVEEHPERLRRMKALREQGLVHEQLHHHELVHRREGDPPQQLLELIVQLVRRRCLDGQAPLECRAAVDQVAGEEQARPAGRPPETPQRGRGHAPHARARG